MKTSPSKDPSTDHAISRRHTHLPLLEVIIHPRHAINNHDMKVPVVPDGGDDEYETGKEDNEEVEENKPISSHEAALQNESLMKFKGNTPLNQMWTTMRLRPVHLPSCQRKVNPVTAGTGTLQTDKRDHSSTIAGLQSRKQEQRSVACITQQRSLNFFTSGSHWTNLAVQLEPTPKEPEEPAAEDASAEHHAKRQCDCKGQAQLRASDYKGVEQSVLKLAQGEFQVHIVEHVSTIRVCVKDKVMEWLASHYGFKTSNNELSWKLLEDNGYIFEHKNGLSMHNGSAKKNKSDGIVFRTAFNPIPDPVIALVFTVVEYAINQWTSRLLVSGSQLTEVNYHDVYKHHLDGLK
ncbi:hypothetical protein JB92DRAFT_3137868 [Gautieria morchelliformis]|nr:hypothetical protein JB92DRAFT_3137868 [Gautieria morchelliformis]